MSRLVQLLDQIRTDARKQGWSDAELARRAGITPEALSRMRTSGGARFETLERLAAVVGQRLKLAPVDDYLESLLDGDLLGGSIR